MPHSRCPSPTHTARSSRVVGHERRRRVAPRPGASRTRSDERVLWWPSCRRCLMQSIGVMITSCHRRKGDRRARGDGAGAALPALAPPAVAACCCSCCCVRSRGGAALRAEARLAALVDGKVRGVRRHASREHRLHAAPHPRHAARCSQVDERLRHAAGGGHRGAVRGKGVLKLWRPADLHDRLDRVDGNIVAGPRGRNRPGPRGQATTEVRNETEKRWAVGVNNLRL